MCCRDERVEKWIGDRVVLGDRVETKWIGDRVVREDADRVVTWLEDHVVLASPKVIVTCVVTAGPKVIVNCVVTVGTKIL